jgi:hypothetical protein
MQTLFDLIRQAATSADLDDNSALGAIQDALGQTDGGFASHFFSGPNGDSWPSLSESARRLMLVEYVRAELLCELRD